MLDEQIVIEIEVLRSMFLQSEFERLDKVLEATSISFNNIDKKDNANLTDT